MVEDLPGTNKVLDSVPSTACRQAGRWECRRGREEGGREGTEERMKNRERK